MAKEKFINNCILQVGPRVPIDFITFLING
jgi:hypothetical protein